jgi:hypothetical protein
MEMMLSGIDPNAGPRGDAYKATFDPSLFGRQLGEAAAARVGEQGQKPEEEEDAELLGSFEAAAQFGGARTGKVFKCGVRGVGYYLDRPPAPVVDAASLHAEAAAVEKEQAAEAAEAKVRRHSKAECLCITRAPAPPPHTRAAGPPGPTWISPANAPVEAKERWVNKLWVLWVH